MKTYRLAIPAILLFIILTGICIAPASAESIHGDFNGWDTNWMSADSFGGIWTVTLTNETVDGSSGFKFDQDGDYDPQWGSGTDSHNASANATIGQVRGSASGESPGNMTIGMSTGKVYTFRLNGDAGWWDRSFVVMETTAWPVDLLTVSDNSASSGTGSVTVAITLSAAKSTEETIYIRYTTNAWTAATVVAATGSSTNYTATIPGQPVGMSVAYYALSSAMPVNLLGANPDFCLLRGKNDSGVSFEYTVSDSGFDPGNSWHFPTNAEPSGAYMRNPPTNGMPPATDVYFYNGTYTNDSDQTGGALFYRETSSGSWASTNLSWDQNTPSGNQYWLTYIPGDTFGAGDEVEYYFHLTYNNADDTYLGSTDGVGCVKYATNSLAETNTYRFTYGAVSYNLGNCWHIPAHYEPPGAYMRNPRNPYSNNTIYVYNGNQFQGAGNPGDQSGGSLRYRLVGAGTWETAALSFDQQYDNNKYWVGAIPADTYAATNVIEYYITVTFNDHDTTYIGTTNSGASSETYGVEADAQSAPFRFTFGGEPGSEAGYLWHNTNRISLGTGNVQFWTKIGYAQGSGTDRWVDHCVIYYTTNGVNPSGTNGVPGADTFTAPLQFNHMEEDTFEQGDAMWWAGIVSNLPSAQGSTIKYMIGAWNSLGSGVERFAEYNTAAQDNQIYEFSLYVAGASGLQVDGVNADYTTTKFFIDEIAGETATFVVHYQPEAGASNVQVYCNVDRRDLCDVDYTNALIAGDGYPDGIKPPDGNFISTNDTGAYFTAFPMVGGPVDYYWTGTVSKCGAYRLTARHQKDAAGVTDWTWYSSDGRRDHAIVASPRKVHEMTMYELNTLTVEAEAANESGRSTFRDLLSTNDVGGDPGPYDPFNLEYLNYIQANCLWFQPIHPSADTDRGDPSGYTPGSPYATRDYFAVSPYFGADTTEEGAMREFTNFVHHCDVYTGSVGTINIMLDGVFNHTSWDAEMGQGGYDLGFCTNVDDKIGWFRPQWYALWTDYGSNATYYHSVYSNDFATAPDRGDFGKWDDVTELFFGRYSALVRHNPANNGDYLNEEDVYDFAGMSTNTMDLWKYFAYYTEYWLQKTGHAGTNSYVLEEDDKGIDGLRCDFGQGLPPQCWEWIINKTRKMKWNFVFMAETLDGGKPGYRSNRHFDVLNEDMVFKFTQAHISNSWEFKQAFEDRRQAYNGGTVLLNLTGHDEVMPENDCWMTASRYGAVSMVDGIPMMFYGQPEGIQAYVGNETSISNTGFESFELNFGKYIPNFKQWNKLTVWESPPINSAGLAQWYGQVNWARHNSPALRSLNRYFLSRTGGGDNAKILAAAKYETPYAGPAASDVVLSFALILDASHTPVGDTYDLQGCWDILG
ncbi:MAG: hypothetical protein EOM20_08265, partial [Spartobacteria bacterium]|nr:hypothetical protein [Spartobacteria bacterium]